jgi:hypothetical protein
MEVKRSSEAIQILSPSIAMPCLLRGTSVEALHNPTVGTSIMSEFLVKNLLGNMLLIPANKLFKSPSGLFFECCGIIRAVTVRIDKNEIHIDFHVFAILEFELLIGHPLDKLIQEKPSHGGLDEKLGIIASTTPISCPKRPKVEQQPNHNPFEEVKFISLFVSPKLAYETERSSSPSLEPKPCPSSKPNVVLNDRDSMLIVERSMFGFGN